MTEQLTAEKPETRSMSETAQETAVQAAAVIIVMLIVIFDNNSKDPWTAGARWMGSAGKALYDQLGWTLTIYASALIAFYISSLGGQIFAEPVAASKIRWVLGKVAQLIVVATVPLVLFIAVSSTQHPETSAIFFVLVPVEGIIAFLGLYLGTFVIAPREERALNAQRSMRHARTLLKSVRLRSHRNHWLVLVVNCAVIATVGTLVIGFQLHKPWSGLKIWGIYFGLAAILLFTAGFGLHSIRTASGRLDRVMAAITPTFLYLAAASLPVYEVSLVPAKSRWPALSFWSFTMVLILTLATTFWPRKWGPQKVLDWTVQGATARAAALTLTRVYSKAAREYSKLKPVQLPPSKFLSRIRNAVRRLSAS